MNEMTWVSIVVLGPGAIGMFVWFLKAFKGFLKALEN